MEASQPDSGVPERDSTQEWLLPAEARPPLVGDLEARIDEAITIARSSQEAVRAIGAQAAKIGAQAVDAASQARRAAELAERASEAALAAASAPVPSAESLEDAWLRGFTERADRVMERLRALEQRMTPARG
jgi:hypothetical protein